MRSHPEWITRQYKMASFQHNKRSNNKQCTMKVRSGISIENLTAFFFIPESSRKHFHTNSYNFARTLILQDYHFENIDQIMFDEQVPRRQSLISIRTNLHGPQKSFHCEKNFIFHTKLYHTASPRRRLEI